MHRYRSIGIYTTFKSSLFLLWCLGLGPLRGPTQDKPARHNSPLATNRLCRYLCRCLLYTSDAADE